MANPFIGVRVSPELNEAIAARMRETGQSKSDVVIAALRSYLGISSPQERLDAIEQRLLALEEMAGEAQSSEIKQHSECHRAKGTQK
jgi:Arc/MetJ-type ribon-helix-helix transcriptional regulator